LRDELVVFRGGGEMASAAARLVFLDGFRVVVLERPEPLALRRPVAFAEAVFAGETEVDGVPARRVERADLPACLASAERFVPVCVDPDGLCLRDLRPDVLVDGRMAKRNLGTRSGDAPFVVGLGPGFHAPADVHAVIETQRGAELGLVRWQGEAQADTGRPAEVLGHSHARVLRSPATGRFRGVRAIGDMVRCGETVAEVGEHRVASSIDGLLRGLLADGVLIQAGVKVGDVDPRGRAVDPYRISEKGRAIAAGTLEAILVRLAVLKGP
jgi:xanthine dehydrogenase accessory factor